MDEDALRLAMSAMGWDADSELPMANAENLCLLKEIKELTELRSELQEEHANVESRVEKLVSHTKNAESTIDHNLKLLHTYQMEVRREIDNIKVISREESKMRENIRNLTKEYNKGRMNLDSTEEKICVLKKKVDNLTNRIQWAKNALVEWNEAMTEGNRGFELIERYFKEDQIKARQQDQRRLCLSNEVKKYHRELVELCDEQKTLEQNLECTAGLYRRAHVERRQMVETWKMAVIQMVQREKDIINGEKRLEEVSLEQKSTTKELRRMDENLNDIIKTNQDCEAEIEELNDSTSDIKEQIQSLIDMIYLKEQEIDLLQKELQNLTNRVQIQRMENRRHEKERAAKQLELDNFGELLKQIAGRLKAIQNKNMSTNQRLQILESMNDTEDKAMSTISKEITNTNQLLYRAQQQLASSISDIKILEVENDGIKVTAQAIKRSIGSLEKELHRQTEIHYTMAFKCLEVEREITRIQGGVLDPDEEERNLQYLTKLETQYAKLLKRLHATEAQNKKLDDNMRKMTQLYSNDSKELTQMSFEIKEAQAYCEGGIKRLKVETEKNQDYIVELSILKMRAKEFEAVIAKCEESTYNLEKHRLQLNRTIKDRMIQLASQYDLIGLKRKHLCEERSTLRADVADRNKYIETVRSRFELTAKLMGCNEDGSLITSTQLKVQTAQEKQLLLDEGDVLNARVLKAEEEVQALENTLLVVNNSNDNFRNTLFKKDADNEAIHKLEQLQCLLCESLTNLRDLRCKIKSLHQTIDGGQITKLQLEKSLQLEKAKRESNAEVLAKLQKELTEQDLKLQRAERELKTAIKAVKKRDISAEFLAVFEHELYLREMENRNTSVLNQLADIAENDDEAGNKIMTTMVSKGLKLPHQLKRTRSCASWRSEVSDLSVASSKDNAVSSRSSTSSDSHIDGKSSAKLSVISLDFNG